MPGTDALVEIAIGLALVGAALWVLRWGWNSRKEQGATTERVEALERAILGAGERDQKARLQEGLDHAAWKKAGRDRRKRRKS